MKITNRTLNFDSAFNKYRSARKEYKKYLRAVFMLVSDAYSFNKKRVIIVILNSAAGVGMLGLSFGTLLQYVKQLESDAVLNYFGYSFNARDGFLLAIISVSVMIFLVLSASLLLYARIKTRDILVDFNLAALFRVTEKYGWEPPDDIAWINDNTLLANIKTLYRGDAQKSALALRKLLEGLQHFFITMGGIVFLFWLDSEATFYLILLIFLSLLFYNKINRRASSSTRKHENFSGESARMSRALLADVASWPNPRLNPSTLKGLIYEGLIKDNIKMFFDRFITRAMTEFLSYVLTGVALGLLVLTLGYAAIKGEKSWAAVVGYIVLLRTVLQAFKSILKMFTSVARQYPGISRLYEFNRKSVPPALSNKKFKEVQLVFDDDAITDNLSKNIVMGKGDIIGIFAPINLTRYSVRFFEKALTRGKNKKQRAAFLGSAAIAVPLTAPPVTLTLRELLGVPEDAGVEELRSAAGSRAGKIEKAISLDPDMPFAGDDLKKLSPDLLKRLSLMSCLLSDKPVFLIHSSLVTEEWLRENKNILNSRIIIVCYNNFPDSPLSSKVAVKAYIAAAADCIIVAAGSFSFMKKKKGAVKKILHEREQKLIAGSERGLIISGSEEEEDDDE